MTNFEKNQLKDLKVIIQNLSQQTSMKPIIKSVPKSTVKKTNSYVTVDDENVLYKINENFLKNRSDPVQNFQSASLCNFPSSKGSGDSKKTKNKNKFKVKFWGNKNQTKENENSPKEDKSKKNSARKKSPKLKSPKLSPKTKNTVDKPEKPKEQSPKTASPKTASPKLRQKVSFLPPPVFTDQHAPMVTVPDDLTIQFSREEANDLLMTANSMPNHGASTSRSPKKSPTRKQSISPQESPRNGQKRRREDDNQNADLEYFAKYVVQKLRKMETNQRIYSENLINTVLMLGQLQRLNGKSRVNEA